MTEELHPAAHTVRHWNMSTCVSKTQARAGSLPVPLTTDTQVPGLQHTNSTVRTCAPMADAASICLLQTKAAARSHTLLQNCTQRACSWC